jgi:hypothetical protein
MARPAVERDEEFIEKLSRRDERHSLPSQLEHVCSHVERIHLQDDGRNCREKAEAMLALLKKFHNALPVIEDVEVRQNSFNLAKIAKDKYVRFALQNWVLNPDHEMPEFFIFLPLAFNEDENCFDLAEFSQRFLQGDFALRQDVIPQWRERILQIQLELDERNNNNQIY